LAVNFSQPDWLFSADPVGRQVWNPKTAETLVVSLFIVIPVVALLVCEWLVWCWSKTVGGKIGWMVFTLLGMLLQFAILW